LNHYQTYVLEEYVEEYHARRIHRRELLRRSALVVGTLPAATAVLAAMGCGGDDDDDDDVTPAATGASPAAATATQPAAPAATATTATSPAAGSSPAGSPAAATISSQDIRFPGPAGELRAHLAQPTGGPAGARYPAVVVIHENMGLLAHFKDVAQRYAKEGFVALALDLASRKGGTVQDGPQVAGFLTQTEPGAHAADSGAAAKYLLGLPNVRQGGVGITGFCFGGGIAFEAAATQPDFVAAVPYYGSATNVLEQLKTTKAAILVMYGATDTRITGQQDQVRAALQASGRPFDIRVYDGAGHAFFNEEKPSYHEASAKDSWTRALAWFRQYLPSA
jgi:carboxymethylenebutenolidase